MVYTKTNILYDPKLEETRRRHRDWKSRKLVSKLTFCNMQSG